MSDMIQEDRRNQYNNQAHYATPNNGIQSIYDHQQPLPVGSLEMAPEGKIFIDNKTILSNNIGMPELE